MKCPFCGDEMRSGYLESTKPFYWSKQKSAIIIVGDVKISTGYLLGCYAESDYCTRCKKIITSVPEKE